MNGKRYLTLMTAVAAIGATVQTVAQASPVAMATNMVGKPEYRAGAGPWKTLGLMSRLSPGDTVRCGPGQEAIVMMFVNGVRFKVASNHSATVASTNVKGAQLMGGAGGTSIRVAKAMTGLDTEPFMARPPLSHQRLDSTSPGILPAGTTSFEWRPLPGAVSYSFTIYDQHDNVIWSTRVAETSADVPSDIPAFATRRPYVWTLSGFGASGKPITNSPWGVITFLTKDDQDKLNADVQAETAEIAANPKDDTPRLLLAELYREYGVYEGTLSTLDDGHLDGHPGLDAAIQDTYAQISPLAQLLAKLAKQSAPVQ